MWVPPYLTHCWRSWMNFEQNKTSKLSQFYNSFQWNSPKDGSCSVSCVRNEHAEMWNNISHYLYIENCLWWNNTVQLNDTIQCFTLIKPLLCTTFYKVCLSDYSFRVTLEISRTYWTMWWLEVTSCPDSMLACLILQRNTSTSLKMQVNLDCNIFTLALGFRSLSLVHQDVTTKCHNDKSSIVGFSSKSLGV